MQRDIISRVLREMRCKNVAATCQWLQCRAESQPLALTVKLITMMTDPIIHRPQLSWTYAIAIGFCPTRWYHLAAWTACPLVSRLPLLPRLLFSNELLLVRPHNVTLQASLSRCHRRSLSRLSLFCHLRPRLPAPHYTMSGSCSKWQSDVFDVQVEHHIISSG